MPGSKKGTSLKHFRMCSHTQQTERERWTWTNLTSPCTVGSAIISTSSTAHIFMIGSMLDRFVSCSFEKTNPRVDAYSDSVNKGMDDVTLRCGAIMQEGSSCVCTYVRLTHVWNTWNTAEYFHESCKCKRRDGIFAVLHAKMYCYSMWGLT